MSIGSVARTGLYWFLCVGMALVSWRFFVVGVEIANPTMLDHLETRALAFYLHVGLAPVALILMPLQFSTRLRARRPGLHRWTGRIYALAILISGLAAIPIALGSDAGPIAAAGFGLLALVWLWTTGLAVWHAMQRRIAAHRTWMIRSAALTFAAVTLRVELPFLIMAFGYDLGYVMVAWLCWVPNLIVAEWLWGSRAARVSQAAA